MIFQSELTSLDSELSQLQALLDAKRQQRTLYNQLQQQTEGYLVGLAKLKNQITEALGDDAIASLKSAVMGLFPNDGNDGGNQPDDPTPDPEDDPDSGEVTLIDATSVDDSDEIEEVSFIDEDSLEYSTLEGQCCHIEQELVFYWERLARPEGQAWDFATPIACLIWEDAPLLGQACAWASPFASPLACTVEFPQPENKKPAYTEFVEVSDRIGYIKVNATGEIKSVYVGFNDKTRAKAWANYLEIVTPRIELRPAKRLGDWKHELKISGLSMKQIEHLTAENLDKMPPAKEPSLPPSYKPRSVAQPVNLDEVGEGDIVTTLLTPGGSYKIIQVMPNGVLDCENLTTGTRLGLRPGAVSLVQKAQKPNQLALDVDAKTEVPAKYARIKLNTDPFDGQVFGVVKETEQGSTLLTPNGHRWFRANCLESIDPDAQTTTGDYKGLSRQVKQRWKKAGVNPSDLIAEMRAKRPPETEWNAAKYNPVLAAIGADDASDF